ncbi:hypothetical protein [Deinococcus deserti]|uniref:hypothetical protein n=1 Tax=Deinococcus deserti TaxID=310783 RepID=UPI001392217F|nr:hypothetical protein [Deinococcus deserti]
MHCRSELEGSRIDTGVQDQGVTMELVERGGDVGDITGGALKGGVIGTVAGLAAGAVVAASGGLAAIPVLLGLGIGAAAGAVHGDGRQNPIKGRMEGCYSLDDRRYDRINPRLGWRAVS